MKMPVDEKSFFIRGSSGVNNIQRKIDIKNARPGMVVARPIYGLGGECLLKDGIELRPEYIEQLKTLKVKSIYVYDERLEGVVVEDVVSEETRLEACSFVREIMDISKDSNGKYRGKIHHLEKRMEKVVTRIIDEILESKENMINLVDIRTADNYTFAHCVNVSVLSSLMTIKMGYERENMKQVALGSLLHDLGKAKIPGKVLKKTDYLTEDEYDMIKSHPEKGYKLFKNNSNFSNLAGDIILQHHERYDGSGYPNGLKNGEIEPAAQAVAIIDVYDALTADRPYRKAYRPHEAIQIFSVSGASFNVDYLQLFLSFVAGYPIGTHVYLSNDESGLVVDNPPGYPLRPKVRVFYRGENLEQIPNPYEIDLAKKFNVVVTEIIEDDPEYYQHKRCSGN